MSDSLKLATIGQRSCDCYNLPEIVMGKRRRKSGLNKRLSDPKVRKEAKATLVSALGIVPILGTALSILNTTKGAMKTARVAKKSGRAYKASLPKKRKPVVKKPPAKPPVQRRRRRKPANDI